MQTHEHDQPSAEELTVAGPQSQTGVTPREPPTVAPRVLTEAQERLMAAVLNCIIPAEETHPGAGDLGVAGTIHRTLAVSPALLRLFCDGLVAIEVASMRDTNGAGAGFTDLDAGQQDAVLQTVERAHPGFFAALVDHAYRGYYTHPRVYQAIGYEHRPPQPIGYELPLFDPAILERQMNRTPFWRRVNDD